MEAGSGCRDRDLPAGLQGYITYLNETEAGAHGKAHSFPAVAAGGLRGLITEKTSLLLSLGYTELQQLLNVLAFCPGTSGWGHLYARLEATTAAALTSRACSVRTRPIESSVDQTRADHRRLKVYAT